MKFTAQIAVVFGPDVDGRFDLWEYIRTFEATTPRAALQKALAISKEIFDLDENLGALGYIKGPALYAVRSLHSGIALPKHADDVAQESAVFLKIASLTESDFERLRRFEDVLVPYHLLHIVS